MTRRSIREELAELRLGLLSAELDKRWALRRLRDDLDVDSVLEAFDRCASIQNAIFYKEAELSYQEMRDELLPPGPQNRRSGEGPPLC